jgi:hypothetical protein
MAPGLERKNVLRDLFDDPVSPQAAAPKLAAGTLSLPLPDQDDKDEVEEAVARIKHCPTTSSMMDPWHFCCFQTLRLRCRSAHCTLGPWTMNLSKTRGVLVEEETLLWETWLLCAIGG